MKAHPTPLPATLNGCHATSKYPGNTLIDIPATPPGLFSQENSSVLARDVQQASAASVDGFTVSWAGNGHPDQTAASTAFSRRLAALVKVVQAHDAQRNARPFHLQLGYEGLDNARKPRPTPWITNDLRYFAKSYGTNPVFRVPTYGPKPVVMFLDSRKFPVATLHGILTPLRPKFTLIGDEHGIEDWSRGVSSFFDGDGWYWSNENPYSNPHAFTELDALARTLHAQHKLWFSPLGVGYNKSNFGSGGNCVPRKGLETLRRLYAGNAQSGPDGWMLISWNEFFENTYIEPSLRYGTAYLDELRRLRSP